MQYCRESFGGFADDKKICEEVEENGNGSKIRCEFEPSTQESILSEDKEVMHYHQNKSVYDEWEERRKLEEYRNAAYQQMMQNIDEKKINKRLQKNKNKLDQIIQSIKTKQTKSINQETIQANWQYDPSTIKEYSYVLKKQPKVFKTIRKNKKRPVKNLSEPELYSDLTRLGFTCTPPNLVICSMSSEQLTSISNFSIENNFGKIEFLSPVNLTNLDLQRTIKISKKMIEVYPDQFFKEKLNKPARGRRLNQPARLIYFDIRKPSKLDLSEFVQKLRIMSLQNGTLFEEYDAEKKTLQVLVEGF